MKAVLGFLLIVVSAMFSGGVLADYTVERITLFVSDGFNSWHDTPLGNPGSSLPASGLMSAQFAASTDASGNHTWIWTLTNASGGTIHDLRFTAFLDVDLGASTNTFFNEYGGLLALGAPTGYVAADRWEVGEPGYLTGDLLVRASTGDLGNRAATGPTAHDDVAWTLSLPISEWTEDETLTITVTVQNDGTEGLWQQDFDDGGSRVFQMVALQQRNAPAIRTVDYAVEKLALTTPVGVGSQAAFRIVVTNNGPDDGTGARVTNAVPVGFGNVQWSCTAQGSAHCGTAGGSGDVDLITHIPVGHGVTVLVQGDALVMGPILSQAQVSAPPSELDIDLGNNHASAAVQVTASGNTDDITPVPWLGLPGLLMLVGLLPLVAWFSLPRTARRRGQRGVGSGRWLVVAISLGLMPVPEANAIFVNGDFEAASFQAWVLRHGLNRGLQGVPPFNENSITITTGGTPLLTVVGAGADPRAPHLVLPRQGNYSAKINDESPGYHLNYIQQRGVITEDDRDPVDGKLHVRFSYAAVLQDPNHAAHHQPFFHVYLKDVTLDETLYDDFAYANQPGRVYFHTRYLGSKWVSTPFIDVDIIVPESSLGHELEIRALGADCALGGHGGYVYVDAFGSLAIPPQGACIQDLAVRGKPGNVQLTWGDTGAAAYAVYRAESLQGPFIKLAETQSRYSTWLDRNVEAGKPYYYSIRALDVDGHEICTSGEVVGIAPEHWNPGDPLNRAPYFTTTPPTLGDVRNLYTYQPHVHDEDGDTLTFVLNHGPIGMTLEATTGALEWQPTATGDFRVNLGVSDGHGHQASQAFAITVHDSNHAPVIQNALPAKVPAGVNFVHQVNAIDPDGDALIYSIGSQAVGVDISTTGRVTWSDPQPGRYPITLVVADIHGARDTQQVVVAVEAFPEFVSIPVVSATVGEPYRYQALAIDRDGDPIEYAVLEGPAGLVVDAANGLVQWTPTAAGNHPIRLGASDPNGNTGHQNYTLRVTTNPNRAPVFTSTPITHVTYPSNYVYSARAIDADGDHLLWQLLEGPPEMEISTNGRVTWSFANTVSGRFPVSIQVDDQRGGVTTQDYELQVGQFTNSPPVISSSPTTRVTAGSSYGYQINASDPDGDSLGFALTQGPAGMTITDRFVSWLPTVAEVGVHSVQVTVSDTAGNAVTQNWSLEVVPAGANRPPVITSTPTVVGTAGVTYVYPVSASDPDGDPVDYALLESPPGMSISAAGRIEWPVPVDTAGSFPVVLEVSDGRGTSVRQSFVIGVGIAANRPPRITSTPVATATAGQNYVYQLNASDPDGDPLAYSVATAEPAITVTTAGRIQWSVPAGVSGTVDVEVQVTDGRGGLASQRFVIGIAEAGNRAPVISSQPGVTATSGATYSYQVTAIDADGDPLAYRLLTAPGGMTISSTGLVEWAIPAGVSGLAPVEIEVSDGNGGVARQGYALSVAGAGNRAPRITSAPQQLATVGTLYAYQVYATDPDGDPLSYSLSQAPAGMTISTAGRIEWIPTAAQNGLHDITIVVADDKGASATQSYGVYAQLATNQAPRITSAAVQRALPGVPYTYQVVATDANGDPITFSLERGPADMVMSATGLVTWASPVLGDHTVEVRAADPHGAYASQTYTLRVAINSAPVITSTPVAVAQVGQPYGYQVVATDADGDFLTYTLTGAPAGFSISATGLLTGTPTNVANPNLRVTVSDGQASVTQDWTLRIQAAPAPGPLSVEVLANPRFIDLGQSTTLNLFIQGGEAPYTVTRLRINNVNQALDANHSTTYTPATLGRYDVQATVRDARNTTATVSYWFSVKDPTDTIAPIAEMTAPGRSDDITVSDVSSISDIVGTASDANLAEYRLLISDAGKEQWSELTVGSTSVTSAKLGSLNPQTIVNGLYDIALIATDLSGNQSSARITVAVEGEQKTAPLQLSFEDLSFDVEGLPLTVTRSYDSLKRLHDLDFGYGWTVDYQNVWVQTNGVLGRDWRISTEGTGFNRQTCVRPLGSRVASVRLPGGQLEQFSLRASPECAPTLTWTGYVQGIEFVPHARNKSGSRLEALGHGAFNAQTGDLFDMGMLEVFNPSTYKLTLLDGTEYYLRADFGIEQIRDRHGNTLQFSANGIHHSGGWALQFTRDAHGRITRIDAPGSKTLSYGYDGVGNLISMTDEIGAVSTYAYNAPSVPHGLTDYTDPLGRLLLKTEYDAEGRVTRQTDGAGRAVTIATDNSANRQTVRDRNGNTTVYTFDERGNVTQVTDALGGITRYAYDAHDNEISVTDPLGRTTTRSFDAYGNITSETDPLGRITTTAYNARGNVTEVTDAAGNVTRNSWSPNNELTRITNPLGQATDLGYTPRGSLLSLTDAAGNQTRYSYAAINGTQLKQSETGPDGTVSTYSYDAAGNVTATGSSLVLSEGGSPVTVTTRSTWDAKGRLISQTDAAGYTTGYHYNAAGELTQETDPLGRVTGHSYNSRGEKTETAYPDGLRETWQYDHNGNETRNCGGNGNLCTQTQYDALNRPVQVTDPTGTITRTQYDAAGQATETTDGRGHTTRYAYDAAGRQTELTNPLGDSITRDYDLAGNLVEETDPLGHRIEHAYNAAGQRTRTRLPTGAITAWGYNEVGQRISETTPEGQIIGFAYDSLGRLVSVTDGEGAQSTYRYNAQGQLLSQTDAEHKSTGYGYDSAGRRVSRTLADGSGEALRYNAVGQLIEKTDFDGATTVWEYGSSGGDTGRLMRIHRPDGSHQQVAYDGHGRVNRHTDSRDGTENLTLDALGRVTQRSLNHSAAQLTGSSAYSATAQYQWDANSNRTRLRLTHPNRDLDATYDAANQLESLTDAQGGESVFTHDAAGRLTHIERSDGSTSHYSYNAAGQLTGIHHQDALSGTLAKFDYTVNLNGQRTHATEEINAGGNSVRRTLAWRYDDAGKLIEERIEQTQPTVQHLTTTYSHDRVGNRTARTISGSHTQSTTYQYDANDRLTQEVDSLHGTTTHRYDLKGNLIERRNGPHVSTYTWNSDNRLTKVETGHKTVTYGYDPQGRRIKKLVTEGANRTETHYVLDTERAYHEIVIERTRTNNDPWQERAYLHTPGGVGELISDSDGTSTRQVYTDGQGSTRLTTDGTTTHSWSFDAFGNLQAGSSAPVTHLYTGERYDPDTGLIYLRARDYDPKTGRFISMDEHPGSQRIPLTLNKYLYANADPVNHVDPSGYFGIGGFSFGGGLASFNTLANMYTIASIGFDLAVGNYAGAAEDIASELICVRFGKALCGLVKKHLGFFFRNTKIDVSKLRLGNTANSNDLDVNLRVSGVFRPPGTEAHHIVGKAYSNGAGQGALAMLRKHNIDANSPLNGVYLANRNSTMSGTIHSGLHTEKYALDVSERLVKADSIGGRDRVLQELDDLRREMMSGLINLNSRGVNP